MEPAWQSRVCAPSEWELNLAEALENVLSQELQDLAQIVDALNTLGSVDPDDQNWTEASFCGEMARLAQGNGLLWRGRSGDGGS
jgi:hypothetical protein